MIEFVSSLIHDAGPLEVTATMLALASWAYMHGTLVLAVFRAGLPIGIPPAVTWERWATEVFEVFMWMAVAITLCGMLYLLGLGLLSFTCAVYFLIRITCTSAFVYMTPIKGFFEKRKLPWDGW